LKKILVIFAVLFFAMAAAVQAQPSLDFILVPSAGSVSFNGGATPLIGSNITVSSVIGVDTPAFPGQNIQLDIENGILNFATGAFTNFVSGPPVTEYLFSPTGGNLYITGSIPDIGANDPNTSLVSSANNLLGTPSVPLVVVTGNGNTGTVSMSLIDIKGCLLANYFGYDPQNPFTGTLSLIFQAPSGSLNGGAFQSSSIGSGNLINIPETPFPPGAPIPGSLLLLGSGIITMLGIGIRRKNA
jgi:hypothetical protein